MNILNKLALFCAMSLFFLINTSFASEFFLKPALTLEYSAPSFSGGGVNSRFKTKSFDDQVKNIDNFALGANLKIHKNLGFNINWAQTNLVNDYGFKDISVVLRPRFKMDYYNFSVLGYIPVEKNLFELFVEGGVSDMNSSLVLFKSSGSYFKANDHETNLFFGGGFVISPFTNSGDGFRFSALKYVNKISLLNTDLTVLRIGYLKRF